jgi:ACS family allantoate permease-like MFS transporter
MKMKHRFYYTFRNKKADKLLSDQHQLAADPMLAFMDMTDRENPAFRYTR